MKNKDISTLAERLLPVFPGFAIKAPLMFIPPVKHMLRGFYFENHSHKEDLFYVWVFLLPLCVPTKYIGFNLVKRIEVPGGGPWKIDMPNLLPQLGAALNHEGLPLIFGVRSLIDLAQVASSFHRTIDAYTQEAIAFALARSGAKGQALAALDGLRDLLEERVPWQHEMAERARLLKALLQDNLDSALRQLEAWEAESIRNLKLERFT